jgi:hypothetical protein
LHRDGTHRIAARRTGAKAHDRDSAAGCPRNRLCPRTQSPADPRGEVEAGPEVWRVRITHKKAA